LASVTYNGSAYAATPGESVLDLLERHCHAVPSACRSGVCQSCLMRAREGNPPAASQSGIKDTLRVQGYFLACRCEPEGDLRVELPADGAGRFASEIVAITPLSETVVELRATCPESFEYRAGQFATLVNECGVARSYSIAGVPGLDDELVFQIALIPGGAMSGWLSDSAAPGMPLHVQGPNGTCFYAASDASQPMVLAGTGTGLAPLYGIARDALLQGHAGAIHLFHGSVREPGLYLQEALRLLEATCANFHYHPCVLGGDASKGVHVGPLDAHLLESLGSLKGYRAYLCGAPDFVKLMQRKVFLGGVSLQEVFADSFLPAVTSR
jgi:ferredoxin-NADP reductase/ferredoxin